MYAAPNVVCKAIFSERTMCLAIVNTGWNGASQAFKRVFCSCDGLLLSMLGFAKLRVAVLSGAIVEP